MAVLRVMTGGYCWLDHELEGLTCGKTRTFLLWYVVFRRDMLRFLWHVVVFVVVCCDCLWYVCGFPKSVIGMVVFAELSGVCSCILRCVVVRFRFFFFCEYLGVSFRDTLTTRITYPATHTRNNAHIITTNSVQHTFNTQNINTKGSHAPGRWLSGSWHTRTLHVRQRSVEMRLQALSSFACLGALEQSLRGSSSPTHFSQFVLGARCVYCDPETACACTSLLPWCVGSLVVLGGLAVLL